MPDRYPLHCLVYGDPGSGKSTFAATWPKPMLVFLFDALGKDGPYIRNGDAGETLFAPNGTPYREVQAPDGLIRLEYYNDLEPANRDWDTFEWRLSQRAYLDEGFKTIVFDSITSMGMSAFTKAQAEVKTKEPRQWHAAKTDWLENALVTQVSALRVNVVVLAHISNDKDEILGEYVRQVAAPGRLSDRKILGGFYSEFYRAYVTKDDKKGRSYLLQTQNDGRYAAATQIDAPDPSWSDYDSIWSNQK